MFKNAKTCVHGRCQRCSQMRERVFKNVGTVDTNRETRSRNQQILSSIGSGQDLARSLLLSMVDDGYNFDKGFTSLSAVLMSSAGFSVSFLTALLAEIAMETKVVSTELLSLATPENSRITQYAKEKTILVIANDILTLLTKALRLFYFAIS